MPRLALNTASLTGDLDVKLRAAKLAGFDGIGLWESDLRTYPQGSYAARDRVAESGLHVPEVFTLRDWQLCAADHYAEALGRARRFFEFMRVHGYDTAVVVGSVDAGPLEVAVEQLRELCDLARPAGVRLAYELFAWGQSFSRFLDGWEQVRRTNRKNVGLVLDTFHFFMSGSQVGDLRDIPADRIFLVHLADAPESALDTISLCRHHRVFPGQGRFPLQALVTTLTAKAFAGWYCLELFNDEYARRDPIEVAHEGGNAVRNLFRTER